MVYKQVSQILTIVTAVPKRHITEHGDRQLKSSKNIKRQREKEGRGEGRRKR